MAKQPTLPPAGTRLRQIWACAEAIDRPVATVRHWYERGLLQRGACDTRTHAVLLDILEVEALALQRPARATRRQNRASETSTRC